MSDDNNNLGEVEIPAHIFVRCAMREFKLRQARQCEGCEHFRGLTERMRRDGPPLPFESQFAVRCAYPVDRELYHVQIDGAN